MFELVTCRRVLDLMVITGHMCSHMLRVNIAIAIIQMVSSEPSPSKFHQCQYHSVNEHEKNNILGFFFIGYCLSSAVSGRCAEKFGIRQTVGTNMVLASLLTFLTPFLCHFHLYYLLASRILLGVLLAVVWPSTLTLAAKWIEPGGTAVFTSHMVASSFGAGLTMQLSGFLMDRWGWPSVFYATGLIAMTWSIFWWALVYDSPDQHPRISPKEKRAYQLKVVKNQVVKNVPWLKMLQSEALWTLVLVNMVIMFSFFIIFNQQNIYFDNVLHFAIKNNGLLASLPYFARYVCALSLSIMVDKLIKSNRYNKTNLRKFLVVSSQLLSTVLSIFQVFYGGNSIYAIFYFTSMMILLGAAGVGIFPNALDLCPNYAGTVFGIANSVGATTGFLGTTLVAFLTQNGHSFNEWRYVFIVLAAVHFVNALTYLLWGSAELQAWNSEEIKDDDKNVELEKFNTNNENVTV